jgi:ribose transport system permease protein
MSALDTQPPLATPLRRGRIELSPSILGLLALLAALVVVGSVFSDRFAATGNFLNVFRASVVTSLLGLGQTVVVLTGNIDLSVGAMISLTGVVVAGLTAADPQALWWAAPAVLLLALGIGLVNGLIVSKLRVHPIVVTLGTGAILQGAALLYSNRPLAGPPQLEDFAFGQFLGLPAGSVVACGLYLVAGFVLRHTRAGRRIYAIGGSASAATQLGLPVDAVVCAGFAVSALCAGLAGVYMVGLLGSGSAIAGQGYELASITPVVLGGTRLAGGVGGVWGTFVAVILINLLNNLLNFLQVSTFYQWVVQGAIILLAVSVFTRPKTRA